MSLKFKQFLRVQKIYQHIKKLETMSKRALTSSPAFISAIHRLGISVHQFDFPFLAKGFLKAHPSRQREQP